MCLAPRRLRRAVAPMGFADLMGAAGEAFRDGMEERYAGCAAGCTLRGAVVPRDVRARASGGAKLCGAADCAAPRGPEEDDVERLVEWPVVRPAVLEWTVEDRFVEAGLFVDERDVDDVVGAGSPCLRDGGVKLGGTGEPEDCAAGVTAGVVRRREPAGMKLGGVLWACFPTLSCAISPPER